MSDNSELLNIVDIYDLVAASPSFLPPTGASDALDDTRREAPHLAGVLCVDIHGFANQTAVEQTRSRSVLIDALHDVLSDMSPSFWWQIDMQHGILIVCPVSPDDVMYLTQSLLLHPEMHRWRLGLHIGVLNSAPDLKGRPQTVGDGVTRASLMASLALPAQALASRAFVEAVSDLRPGYSALFMPAVGTHTSLGSSEQGMGLSPHRWRVAPSSDWLILLRNEVIRRSLNVQGRRLAAAQAATQRAAQSALAGQSASPLDGIPATSAVSAPAPAEVPPWTQARDLIARWFVPVNALLVSIGLLLSQGHRFGLNERRLLAMGLTLAALACVWLLLSRLSSKPVFKGYTAAAWVGLSYGALLSLGATAALVFALPQPNGNGFSTLVTPLEPAPPVPSPAPVTTSVSVTPPAASVAPTAAEAQAALAPLVPSAAPAEAQGRPTAAPRVASVASSPRPGPTQVSASETARASAHLGAPEMKPAPTPSEANPANASRCNAIVARSALGEPLSPEDRQELLTSCR